MAADTPTPQDSSLMDDPETARDPEPAIDYAHAAGEVIEPVRAGAGDMPVERQSATFDGFMSISRYAGAAIVLIVFWATLVFALGASNFAGTLSTLGLGLLLAPVLKLRGAYVPVLILSVLLVLGVGFGAGLVMDGPDIPEPAEIEVDAATDDN